MSEARWALPPPPEVDRHAELWPIIDPPARGQAPPHPSPVEQWEPFESGPPPAKMGALPPTDGEAPAQERALAHPEAAALLAGKRHVRLGASALENKRGEAGSPSVMHVAYSYDDDAAVEIHTDPQTGEVTRVTTADYQPAPTQEEIQEAIRLAREDRRLERFLTEEDDGTALLITADDPDHGLARRRLFDVRFGPLSEPVPRFAALVDLSTQKVLDVHEVEYEEGEE